MLIRKIMFLLLLVIALFLSCSDAVGRRARNNFLVNELSPNHMFYFLLENSLENIQEITVASEYFDMVFKLVVTLPPGYNENESYPVFIMTDGDHRLFNVRDMHQMMLDKEITDIILVNICYANNVSWAMTSQALTPIRYRKFIEYPGRFLDFITNTVTPLLCDLYNIDNTRSALMGHSWGGQFVHYALFNSDRYINQPFNYYVIASGIFCTIQEERHLRRNSNILNLDKTIYLSVGGIEDPAFMYEMMQFIGRMNNYNMPITHEIFERAGHSNYIPGMLRNVLLMWYGFD